MNSNAGENHVFPEARNPVNSIALRDVNDGDLPIFFEHQYDPIANEMAAFPARERDAFMAHWVNNILGDLKTEEDLIA
jgi:hypothetical protein